MSDPFAREPGQLSIDIWSDVVCPFCYMGETILSEALENFEHRDSVVVRYHSYQLMPELSADEPVDLADLLSQSKGLTPEQVIGMQEQLVARGTDLGIDYRFDQTQTINTRAAHRLTHFAQREDPAEAIAVLEADEYAADVDVDIALAQQIGIGGVPFFVFNGKYAVSGAQPVEAFDEVLRQAWSDEG